MREGEPSRGRLRGAPDALHSAGAGADVVDFRYHLVSIIAVFLSLALGIVLGTAALNGQLLDNLKGSIDILTADKRTLEGTIGDLRAQSGSDEQLAEQLAPVAVSGRLAGQRVLVVRAPNAVAGTADALVPLLQAAGATVTGGVQLRPDLLDPEQSGTVQEVLRQVDGGAGDEDEPVQEAADRLAEALLGDAFTPVDRGVLDALAGGDLVDVDDDLTARADLSVLVTGDPVASTDPAVPQARARALLSVAAALDAAGGGVVVAGPLTATDEGGAVRALREDGALSERVSSVDGVDRPQGRLATVYALVEQESGGSGRYGSGPGNEGPLPSLPTP